MGARQRLRQHGRREMIVGTAGHVDHGKTALVQALTGVDTDRLPEEKRRGITIDLGFAPLELDGFGTVGVVDVPGHEAFVRTMVAGASGIDVALLVVAADEGVMPQTREHAAILSLLGVSAGVVAVTKTDLCDADWISLVEDDVRALLSDTPLSAAPLLRVSARTGDGIETLRAELARTAAAVDRVRREDLMRMPIDRVFTMRGTGTVVTGTVWSGAVKRGSAWIHPPGRAVRVRDVQSHGASVDAAPRGARAAVALADVAVADLARGAVLVDSASWEPTSVLRVRMEFLPDAPRPTPRTRVRFHHGAADVEARIVALGGDEYRVRLASALIVRGGDRFVVRSGGTSTTVGGGVVTDPFPPRRGKALGVDASDRTLVLARLAEEAGPDGLRLDVLAVRLGVAPACVAAVVRGAELVVAGDRAFAASAAEQCSRALLGIVAEAHRASPLSQGVSVGEARGALRVDGALFDHVVSRLIESRRLAVTGASLHEPGWRPRLDDDTRELADRIMHAFCAQPDAALSVAAVTEQYGDDALAVLKHLEHSGKVVRLSDGVVVPEPVVRGMIDRLREHMTPGTAYTPAQLRDGLGVSRKLLIPLLEYCDRANITERRGSERLLRSR